jgi:hypothetical protein
MESVLDYNRLVTHDAMANALHIAMELQWFEEVLLLRSAINSGSAAPNSGIYELAPPVFDTNSAYSRLIAELGLGFEERMLLMLALVPHVKPQVLDLFLVSNQRTGQIYTEFGGRKGKVHNGFLPTAETFMFILATDDLTARFGLLQLFRPEHSIFRHQLLEFENAGPGEPILSMPLTISPHYLEILTTGELSEPSFSPEFPARRLLSGLTWNDLVLSSNTTADLEDLDTWLKYNETLMVDWDMGKRLAPGYKALFHGPPGTGKTLAAALLGNKHEKPVFRIDLSQVVSKYIGETGKNLSRVFDRAENRGWILFFDEADSLFGKRTKVQDSHDRYANQEVSYLLQRIEDYNGLVILASNFKNNMDDAFVRRFQSIIHFPMPGQAERLRLWTSGLPKVVKPEAKLSLKEIASKFELSGGNIMNVIRYASFQSLKRNSMEIRLQDIMEGIKSEMSKIGRTIS